MIFKPELAEKILKGEKTQTRRIVKVGERLITGGDGTKFVAHLLGSGLSLTNSRLKWQTGKTYAIKPGRTKAGIGRLKLLDIRRERVRDISPADASAEGVDSLPEIWKGIGNQGIIVPDDFCKAFFNLFESINGKGSLDKEVWVLVFEAVK